MAAFAPTFAWFWARWTVGVYRNGHGIFMPLLIGYFAWEHLKQDRDPVPRSSPLGWLFLGAGLALLALDSAIHSQLLGGVAFVVALPGIALLLLGAERTRGIAFPLAISVFMLPIPTGALSQLYMVLRTITAIASSHLVPLFGVPLEREGTLLRLPHSLVEVADNCSGYSTLYAAILAAIVLAHLTPSPRRRAAVLLAAVPLALVCNILRVTALVLLVHVWGPHVLETQLHPLSGMALFVLVVGALLLIAGRGALRGQPGHVHTPLSDRPALGMFALCSLALVPVVAHSYLGWRSDDCANPGALVPAMAPGASPELAETLRRNFGEVYQWREGRLAPAPGAPELRFVVVRSYDPKTLYYRGVRRIWQDVLTGADTVEWLDSDAGKLPIARSQTETEGARGPETVIASMLVYGGKPVETGWLAQLEAAPAQVLTGARPMTLFAVRGDVPADQLPAAEQRARQWLLDSWRNYRAICGG